MDTPTVTYTGENVAEVQEFLRARNSDVCTEFDSATGLVCTVRTPEDDYPLIPGDAIIQDTAGSVFVMPRGTGAARGSGQ